MAKKTGMMERWKVGILDKRLLIIDLFPLLHYSITPIFLNEGFENMLQVNNIEVAYMNVIQVLRGVSLEVGDGKLLPCSGRMVRARRPH